MSKILTVASQYTVYEIEEDSLEVFGGGMVTVPPQIVLEMMVLQNRAKRVGVINTLSFDSSLVSREDDEEEDYEGDPPEGEGPWMT